MQILEYKKLHHTGIFYILNKCDNESLKLIIHVSINNIAS